MSVQTLRRLSTFIKISALWISTLYLATFWNSLQPNIGSKFLWNINIPVKRYYHKKNLAEKKSRCNYSKYESVLTIIMFSRCYYSVDWQFCASCGSALNHQLFLNWRHWIRIEFFGHWTTQHLQLQSYTEHTIL